MYVLIHEVNTIQLTWFYFYFCIETPTLHSRISIYQILNIHLITIELSNYF